MLLVAAAVVLLLAEEGLHLITTVIVLIHHHRHPHQSKCQQGKDMVDFYVNLLSLLLVDRVVGRDRCNLYWQGMYSWIVK